MPTNPYYNRQVSLTSGDLARAGDINLELDAIQAAFDALQISLDFSIGVPASFAGNRTVPVQSYAGKIFYVNASGNVDLYAFSNVTEYEAIANASAASAALAEKWAEEAEDIEVVSGSYSAMHWSLKAQALVQGGASNLAYTPTGELAATNVSDALDELENEKASAASVAGKMNVANPVYTGTMTHGGYISPATTGTIGLNPLNGFQQTFVASGDITFTDGLAIYQSMLLALDTAGGVHDFDWPINMQWKTNGGNPPGLNVSGLTFVLLWKSSSAGELFGARIGDS